jgi:hypothetical protein
MLCCGETSKLSLLPASAGFLLGLLFDPEDGGNVLLRNMVFSPNYTELQPRRLLFNEEKDHPGYFLFLL